MILLSVTKGVTCGIYRPVQVSNMKQVIKALFTLWVFFLFFSVQAQNDIVIGGGSDVGALLCEGKVYTWGKLGTSSPALVTFPAGAGTIKQVSAGSGSHFLAVD